jgi:anti-sigma-K factor RskA
MSRATGPDHERFQDAAGAYVLGALPDAEYDAYVAHLESCPACRAEVDELTPAADALPVSVMQMVPPPELKGRIMAEVEREAELLAAAGPQADRPPERRRERRRWFSWGLPQLATGLAVLAVGIVIGVGAANLGGDTRTISAQVDPTFSKSAKVELEMHDGATTLVASGLPAPPQGRVYQLWLKKPGQAPQPTSALFRPSRDGTATAAVTGSLKGVEQVLMTDEPDGGSQQPSTKPVLSAELS